MSTYHILWLAAQAKNEPIILALMGCGGLLAAGWFALGLVPERWRSMAETAYLVSIGALYAAVLLITGGNR